MLCVDLVRKSLYNPIENVGKDVDRMKKPIQIAVCVLLVVAVVVCFILNSQRVTIGNELSAAKQTIADMTSELETLTKDNSDLKNSLAEATTKNTELQNDLDEAVKTCDELKGSLETITDRLTNGASEILPLLGVQLEDLLTVTDNTAVPTEETAPEETENAGSQQEAASTENTAQ